MSNSDEDFSVAVIIIGAEGVPIVKERCRKGREDRLRWWKFPGGHGKKGETPKEAAIRETLEETNIEIFEEEIEFLLMEERENPVFLFHRFYLFIVNISDVRLPDRCKGFLFGKGITGEKTKIAKLGDISIRIELQSHQKLLRLPEVQKKIQKILQDKDCGQKYNKARHL